MPIDILLPTFNRLSSLVMTLSGLAAQRLASLRIVIADQSDYAVADSPVVRSLGRMIEARGGTIEFHRRPLRRGIAEQRDFLLQQATADEVLYLDDDVFLESWVLEELHRVLQEEGCAFVGAFPQGMSFRGDVRPDQQKIEYWEGPVEPEIVEPESPEWERWQLHRAANLYHVAYRLPPGRPRRYKVAWVAQCVLYDRVKLCEVGGFAFWRQLPTFQSGEEVLVQNLLMRRWGGCAIAPSGAYSSQLPSTVLNGHGSIDGHALDLLPEMVARYAPEKCYT